ncbi:hypothetical protein [Senegalia massiliensis]|uniref:Uncharacterized protein n=1 Tax=Senegalia massiliensis TaxID=1720316 RepID=A0A845R0C8_9CLOT|nr:hypothetical protein [Senegalia massiliensis]NBI07674.1 hypothetical protein [Senegalia massiliensis]
MWSNRYMVDVDGDGELELVDIYNFQEESYFIILKYYYSYWYVVNIFKERHDISSYFDYEIIRDDKCRYKPFVNQDQIDLSSIEYICSETQRDIKLEKALIKEFNLDRYKDNIRYYYNKIDLDGDGIPEIFVYLVGSLVCGTGGCSAAIFKQENGKYKLLTRFSLVNNPVIISNSKTNGYKDIIMNVYGGGIKEFFALIKYDGITYPSNPSIQPKLEPDTKVDGIAIVADNIAENPGIKLFIKSLSSLDFLIYNTP